MALKTFNELFPTSFSIYGGFNVVYGTYVTTLDKIGFNWEEFYALIRARHGTDLIIGDETQWQYRFFAVLYEYGGYWAKQQQIQTKLLTMEENEVRAGSLSISSSAMNPAEKPADTFEGTDISKIDTINTQNTTTYQKNARDAYVELSGMLRTNYTEDFLRKFDKLFKKILDLDFDDEDEEGGES